MHNYKRSRDRLIKIIKEVFGVKSISMDTKLIVLVLAGTLPRARFRQWIDKIPGLNPLYGHFNEINLLRCKYGTNFRDYILLIALQEAKSDVNSDELQSLIADTTLINN